MSDELGWVIERDLHSALHYWAGRGGNDWRADHMEALRFARRADAELMLTYHCLGIGRVAEHVWCDVAATAVFINGETHAVSNGGRTTYARIVELAGLRGNPSVTVSFGNRDRAAKILSPGNSIDLDAGAHVTVVHTGNNRIGMD